MTSEIVRYKADNGQDIEVTEQDVRDLMAANGTTTSNVTAQEIKTYLRLCQAQRLNPFTKDAYLVKYGTSPATIIAGKETFTKRAQRNPRFRGFEAGITIFGTDGKLHRREGSMLLDGEIVVGGWCKVYIAGYEAPMYDEVSFSEYNTGKSNWLKIPATMIRKVAICHALREAFPEDLGGLYGAEEMDQAAPQQSYEEPAPQAPAAVAVEAAQAPPEPPAARPIDEYKLALVRARDERGVPVKEAMAKVRETISKPPEEYDAADIASAVAIVDALGAPEPEYELVEEPLPLPEYDIPF